MDLVELGSSLGAFFDGGRGPSHDELDHAFQRSGLGAGDPRRGDPLVGKTKRIRQVLVYATDHDPAAGLKLAQQVINLLRAHGSFHAASTEYVGSREIASLRRALKSLGFDLDETGAVRPIVIDNLAGTELTDALKSYVNRINLNPDDTALHLGTGKELDEAAARHVLVERTGSYPVGGHQGSFPVTLAHAFTTLNLAIAPPAATSQLDPDPHKAVQQALFQLALTVNRLRNAAGSGHGRPGPPSKTAPLTPEESRLVARATALIAGALLDSL